MNILKTILKWGGILLGVAVVLGGGLLAHTWYGKPLKIDWFFDRVVIQHALSSPQLLSNIGVLDAIGIRGHNAHLDDGSDERTQAIFDKLRKDLETLRRYDYDRLGPQERLSYDIFENFAETVLEAERWRHHTYPVNPTFGIQSGLPDFMLNIHRLEDEKGAEHYISRLSQFDRRLGQALDGIRLRAERGVIPPTFVVEKVLEEMRAFIDTPAEAHVLYTHLDDKLGEMVEAGELDEARRGELGAKAKAAIEDSVYPVYRELITYHEQLLPRTRGDHGVWMLPEGDEMYRLAARLMTTTGLAPDEIHEIGLAEVERIGAEMDAILVELGYTEGTIGERMHAVRTSPEQLYEDSEAGRDQVIADFQALVDEADAAMDSAFNIRPEAGVEVRRVPDFREATAPLAYYSPPSMDGARPGVFYINLRDIEDIPRMIMPALAYHEAIPGHHFQIALAMELEGIPIFRRVLPVTAYIEGWGLYTEQLAWEMGLIDDPYDNLGRLQFEMWRALRLVVDTGMHAKRWEREETIQYMMDMSGMGESEVTAEVDRYLVMPGQALAYKIGMIKILELRERAREALGEDFDLRAFHDVILTHGAVPLDILERLVGDWIDASG